DRVLGPVGHDDLFGRVADVVGLLVPARDGLPQFGNAGGGRVMGVAVLHRFHGGGANVFGRGEVRLAEAKVENGLALRLHLLGFDGGGHGGGRLHGGGQLRDRYHDGSSSTSAIRRPSFRAKR